MAHGVADPLAGTTSAALRAAGLPQHWPGRKMVESGRGFGFHWAWPACFETSACLFKPGTCPAGAAFCILGLWPKASWRCLQGEVCSHRLLSELALLGCFCRSASMLVCFSQFGLVARLTMHKCSSRSHACFKFACALLGWLCSQGRRFETSACLWKHMHAYMVQRSAGLSLGGNLCAGVFAS